jgi:hypothetical protein
MLAYRVDAIDEDGHISGPADIIDAADEAARCQITAHRAIAPCAGAHPLTHRNPLSATRALRAKRSWPPGWRFAWETQLFERPFAGASTRRRSLPSSRDHVVGILRFHRLAQRSSKLAADLRSRARDSRIGRQGIFGRDVIRGASRNCRTTLEAGNFDAWLTDGVGSELLNPAANGLLQRWPVSRRKQFPHR